MQIWFKNGKYKNNKHGPTNMQNCFNDLTLLYNAIFKYKICNFT